MGGGASDQSDVEGKIVSSPKAARHKRTCQADSKVKSVKLKKERTRLRRLSDLELATAHVAPNPVTV